MVITKMAGLLIMDEAPPTALVVFSPTVKGKLKVES